MGGGGSVEETVDLFGGGIVDAEAVGEDFGTDVGGEFFVVGSRGRGGGGGCDEGGGVFVWCFWVGCG